MGFVPIAGKFVGTIKDENGNPIALDNLWGVASGGGNKTNRATNELFVTVDQGIGSAELAGTFLKIVLKPY